MTVGVGVDRVADVCREAWLEVLVRLREPRVRDIHVGEAPVEGVVEVVEAVVDVAPMGLGGIHRLRARRRQTRTLRRDEGGVDPLHLDLDRLPVGLRVALRPGGRLLPRVRLAPALLRLGRVLVAETIAEELLHLLGRGGLLVHLSLQCSVDGVDELA